MIIDKQYSVSHREVCHFQFNTSRSFSGPHSLSLYTTLLSLSPSLQLHAFPLQDTGSIQYCDLVLSPRASYQAQEHNIWNHLSAQRGTRIIRNPVPALTLYDISAQ